MGNGIAGVRNRGVPFELSDGSKRLGMGLARGGETATLAREQPWIGELSFAQLV